MRLIRVWSSAPVLAVLLTLAVAACGGGDGATGPGATAPVISTANTMVFLGQSVTFNATGGGTIRWGGDNSAVATVDQVSGRVTGVGLGRVTIWAENAGGRTTRLLRVLPSFAGTWQGTYEVVGCAASGAFTDIGFCTTFATGLILQSQMQLSQTDDRVTGSITFGASVPGTVHASTVDESGVLPLTATVPADTITVTIGNARLQSATPGVMTGSFEQLWTLTGFAGTGTLYSELRSFPRVSGGPTLGLTPPSGESISLEEMIRRVRQHSTRSSAAARPSRW